MEPHACNETMFDADMFMRGWIYVLVLGMGGSGCMDVACGAHMACSCWRSFGKSVVQGFCPSEFCHLPAGEVCIGAYMHYIRALHVGMLHFLAGPFAKHKCFKMFAPMALQGFGNFDMYFFMKGGMCDDVF